MPKRKHRHRNSRQHMPSLSPWKNLLKLGIVTGIWLGIGLMLMTAWYATELPDLVQSAKFERKSSIVFKAADGSVIDRYGEMKGTSLSVKDLPPHLIQAVIATEDRRFYKHHGIDFAGLARAMTRNIMAGHLVQGGSTITQQLAKNLFLTQERTLKRKIQEAILALWLEHELTKDEILGAYLNRVYLGGGAYGVDAAARIYFNKSAHDINLREAAILAGLLKAPSRYSPENNPGLSAQRARIVLAAMHDAGYITEEEAKRQSLSMPLPQRKPSQGGNVHYFTDWVASSLEDLIGSTDRDLIVETTLDPAIQKTAEQALIRALQADGGKRRVSQGAAVVMGLDGAVLAMVGGRDYDSSQFNRATQALRAPGSSFKPIVYLSALQQGWREDDMIVDAPITEGRYRPDNYKNEYLGEVTLRTALTLSLNTAAVRLLKETGVGNAIAVARRLGIRAKLHPDLSLALGSSGVPMLEMAGAYAVIGNGGYSVLPYSIERITDSSGKLLYQRQTFAPASPLFPPSALQALDRMMQNVIQVGTGQGASVPFRAAGKTGTSQDFRDAWFIGYTDKHVAAVWVGNDDNSSMKGVTGGTIPAPVWRDIMMTAHQRPGKTPIDYAPSSSGFSGLLDRLLNE